MFRHEHLDLTLKQIKNQNGKKLNMPRRRPHPRCRDFFRVHQGPMILEFVTVNAKNTRLVSQDANKTLKSLRRRSFYKAIEIVSEIENIGERNSILQILYSVATYGENNHSINLLKLWIDDIYVKKIVNTNQFIHRNYENLRYTHNIIIKLGFEYKVPPLKKEPLW